MQSVALLGATGSIGTSALDVLARYPERFRLYAVTANTDAKKLATIAHKFEPKVAVIADESKLSELKQELKAMGCPTIALGGHAAIDEVARDEKVDIVIGAIVGAAGISSTFAAAESGKKLLLANKESVVCGGAILMDLIARSGAELLPVDSEHNAIFQCLVGASAEMRSNAKILLTCSGGPFRQRKDLTNVTVAEATHHPNWSMGKKITVDSATLMNKGLEVIEARWLFDFTVDRINVVVHPQSVIHSMVQYEDGVIMAQMGSPDMRNTIAYSLGFPQRLQAGVEPLNLTDIRTLTFEEPDLERFPQLGYAYKALEMGAQAPIVLNAANEIGVEAFLAGRIKFTDIALVCRSLMFGFRPAEPKTLNDILELDVIARNLARNWVDGYCGEQI